jgi:hypothetical protein
MTATQALSIFNPLQYAALFFNYDDAAAKAPYLHPLLGQLGYGAVVLLAQLILLPVIYSYALEAVKQRRGGVE